MEAAEQTARWSDANNCGRTKFCFGELEAVLTREEKEKEKMGRRN